MWWVSGRQVFGETVGRLPGSYLAQERGFEAREREFRREMDTVHSSTHSELTLQVSPASLSAGNGITSSCLQVERSRDKLLVGVVQQLQTVYETRHVTTTSSSNPPLCVYRIKVSNDVHEAQVPVICGSLGRLCLRTSQERGQEYCGLCSLPSLRLSCQRKVYLNLRD